jgi:hypothetical protein
MGAPEFGHSIAGFRSEPALKRRRRNARANELLRVNP